MCAEERRPPRGNAPAGPNRWPQPGISAALAVTVRGRRYFPFAKISHPPRGNAPAGPNRWPQPGISAALRVTARGWQFRLRVTSDASVTFRLTLYGTLPAGLGLIWSDEKKRFCVCTVCDADSVFSPIPVNRPRGSLNLAASHRSRQAVLFSHEPAPGVWEF